MFEKELRYYLVMLTAKKLLEEGLLTTAEYRNLEKEMQKKYTPFLMVK